MIRIGFMCTAGGSVVEAAYKILKNIGLEFEFYIVTDRECGAEVMAKKMGIIYKRFEVLDSQEFSEKVAEWLYEFNQVDFVVLFSARLIGSKVYETGKCYNIHPSVLPSFPGLNALNKTIAHGAKFFGATLHLVDAGIDTGPIYAQIVSPIDFTFNLQDMENISHAHKLYLLLKLIEDKSGVVNEKDSLNSKSPAVSQYLANPEIKENEILKQYYNYVRYNQIKLLELS